MRLDQSFAKFRDDSFTKFLRQLLANHPKATYISGDASEFTAQKEKLQEINSQLRLRGGLLSNLMEWSAFVEPIEAARFLLVVDNIDEALELLDAVVEQERPATAESLKKVYEEPLPSSMKAIMLGAGGEARIQTSPTTTDKIMKPVNKSGLNLEAMKEFR